MSLQVRPSPSLPSLLKKASLSRRSRADSLPTGNGGTLFGDKTVSVAIPAEDFDALVAFAVRSNVRSTKTLVICPGSYRKLIMIPLEPAQVNLVIPGPEQPLVDGIETVFRHGAFFGP